MKQTLQRLATQLTRFSLVGVANTGIDFLVTNLLFLALRPTGMLGLTLISLLACLVAATNSYLVNSRWTFTDRANRDGQIGRFVLFAGLGVVVNTAVFLFLIRYLPLVLTLDPVSNLNVAKLGGVVCAMAVTFIGYRFGVFYSASITSFRRDCRLQPADGRLAWRQLWVILAIALVARMLFVAMAPVAYGDAVSYSWVAWLTARGEWQLADPFWHSLFDFWQALLLLTGLEQYPALVLASLLPGLLLVVPVYLLTRRLYGDTAALVAGLFIALHPRLVEYSVNGYAETFYLHAAMWAVWGITAVIQDSKQRGAPVVIGIALAGYFLVRNEAVLLVILLGAVALLLAVRRSYDLRLAIKPTALFAACVIAYVVASQALWDQNGLFSKSSNLGKQNLETLDIAAAARETYGAPAETHSETSPGDTLKRLAARWPANLMYTAERLPGILLSPVVVLAILLPLLVARRGYAHWDELPLLVFTIWPLVFYPLVQLEPRLLFPTLIGTGIFGAAGAIAAGRLIATALSSSVRRRLAEHGVPAMLVLLLLPLLPALAWNSDQSRGYHREVGAWLAAHIPPGTGIAGDGYGYVSSSSFWAGRKGEPRLWVADAGTLASVASERQQPVLLLFEEYLRSANPQLLPVLDEGIPGMQLAARFEFPRVGRVQVWTLDGWLQGAAIAMADAPHAGVSP
ncbi:MAG: GtrA family protein [Gammaproteobacteria bacterium]|nr:GtrA family protein [Gammaproteobacteria bacterium]